MFWTRLWLVIVELSAVGIVVGGLTTFTLFFFLSKDKGEDGADVLIVMVIFGVIAGVGNALLASAGFVLSALVWGPRTGWPTTVRVVCATVGAAVGAVVPWIIMGLPPILSAFQSPRVTVDSDPGYMLLAVYGIAAAFVVVIVAVIVALLTSFAMQQPRRRATAHPASR